MAEKHAGGRPTKYDPIMLKQVRKLVFMGANEKQIADFFEINRSNFKKWKIKLPEFRAAIDQAKEDFNANVVNSLYRRSMGYTHKAVKIIYDPRRADAEYQKYFYALQTWEDEGSDPNTKPEPPGEDAGVIKVAYKERYAPDTNAIKFFLTNRQPDQWKERNTTELTGAEGGPIQTQPLEGLTYEQLMALKYGKESEGSTEGTD